MTQQEQIVSLRKKAKDLLEKAKQKVEKIITYFTYSTYEVEMVMRKYNTQSAE